MSVDSSTIPPTRPAASTTIVILGASGDLTRRLLFPALHRLMVDGYVASDVSIVGYAIDDLTTEAFVERLRSGVEELGGGVDPKTWDEICTHMTYVRGDFAADSMASLASRIPGNALFYLALPPALFGTAAIALGNAGLSDQEAGWRRLIVEKPFGTDSTSAKALQAQLDQHWRDSQVLRIDHFLGKDSVQNMLAFRLANRFIEAIWNSNHIAQVQITASETLGVEGRWRYYDGAGALRDMLQNHLMQLFALTVMEPVASWDSETLRNHKVEALRSVRPMTADDVPSNVVRGRYGVGSIAGTPVNGYLEEPNIPATSSTETYAALRLWVDNWRWQGVPFYLRSGKRLSANVTEIALQLRPVAGRLFAGEDTKQRWIVLRIRPEETISIEAVAKEAGLGMHPADVVLSATDTAVATSGEYSAYEQLLLDALVGESGHFIRSDEAAVAWNIVQPVIDAWATDFAIAEYVAGSDGPTPPDGFFRPVLGTWRSLS